MESSPQPPSRGPKEKFCRVVKGSMRTGRRMLVVMMECCTRKRMVAFVSVLVLTCLVFVAVEEALTTDDEGRVSKPPLTQKRNSPEEQPILSTPLPLPCWAAENYSIKEECQPCTHFEKASGHLPICSDTGYKERVLCESSGSQPYRSCLRPDWLERRNFYLFELVNGVVGVACWTVAHLRQRHLDRKMMDRLQKQIAAGV